MSDTKEQAVADLEIIIHTFSELMSTTDFRSSPEQFKNWVENTVLARIAPTPSPLFSDKPTENIFETTAYIVCTEYRGVFYGYNDRMIDASIQAPFLTLDNARMCVKWENVQGILELAVAGPNDSCRISMPVKNITLAGKFTAVIPVSPVAVLQFEANKWAK